MIILIFLQPEMGTNKLKMMKFILKSNTKLKLLKFLCQEKVQFNNLK